MKQKRRAPLSNEFSAEVKREASWRAGFTCEFPDCQRVITRHHHIWRRGQGGPGTLENCMCLCTAHHDYIHANPAESFEHGWLRHPPPTRGVVDR